MNNSYKISLKLNPMYNITMITSSLRRRHYMMIITYSKYGLTLKSTELLACVDPIFNNTTSSTKYNSKYYE